MTTGIKDYRPVLGKYTFWAVKNGVYPYGASGTLANGSDSGMIRHKSFGVLTPEIPAPNTIVQLGDGGVVDTYFGAITDALAGSIAFFEKDNDFDAAVNARSVYTDGDHTGVMHSAKCVTYNPLAIVHNSTARSRESATFGEEGWVVYEWFSVTSAIQDPASSGTDGSPTEIAYPMTITEPTKELTGLTISNANYGVSSAYVREYWSENPVTLHTYVGDGATTTVTLDYTPAAASGDKVRLWIDGAEQTYTTNFTVSGTTVTFVVAPAAGEVCIIKYEFQADC